jgi:hypothetical protein
VSLAVALVGLALGLVLNTVLGPLGLDALDYPISQSVENQLVGLELVSVLLVAPWCLASALLSRRGHPAGAPLAIGPAAYTAYMFVQYVLGPEHDTYTPGVLLHLALFTLGLGIAVWAWVLAVGADLSWPARHRRRHAAALGLLAAFVLSRYAGGLAAVRGDEPIPAEFDAEPTFYWSIFLLDLGVVLPATVVAAVTVWRGARPAAAALYGVVGWFALVPPSVASMGAVMLARDDPYAAPGQVVVLATVALLFAAYAVVVFRSLFRQRETDGPGVRQPGSSAHPAGAELDRDPWPHRLGRLGDAVVPGALARATHDDEVTVTEGEAQ